MDNKEQLIEAIDNYDTYSVGYRRILRLLVELAIDDSVYITVLQLSKISLFSREMIYQALDVFQRDGLIEISKKSQGKTTKISQINLKPNRLNQLKQFYNKQLEVQRKYTK
jgi:DNA-binding transcriptional ArsR family regulator